VVVKLGACCCPTEFMLRISRIVASINSRQNQENR